MRLANPKNRMEAITSRPKLLSAVGRLTNHGGQSKILLTVMHESVAQIKRLVANVRAGSIRSTIKRTMATHLSDLANCGALLDKY